MNYTCLSSLVLASILLLGSSNEGLGAADTNSLFLDLKPNKDTYVAGEAIIVQVVFSNMSSNAVGSWVTFVNNETTVTYFNATNFQCQTVNRGVSGTWQGPWQ